MVTPCEYFKRVTGARQQCQHGSSCLGFRQVPCHLSNRGLLAQRALAPKGHMHYLGIVLRSGDILATHACRSTTLERKLEHARGYLTYTQSCKFDLTSTCRASSDPRELLQCNSYHLRLHPVPHAAAFSAALELAAMRRVHVGAL